MKISVHGSSDLGRKRSVNEDNFKICPNLNLYLVADGMGGHIAGEIASRLAVDIIASTVQKELEKIREGNSGYFHPGQLLRKAIQVANQKILETTSKRIELEGMGTTIVAGTVHGKTLHIASVGDSRIYRFRGNQGELLTSDHSWVNMQVRLGNMTPEEARYHPMRNVITRALGTQRKVEVDIMAHLIRPGDTILLCTDGLSNLVQLEEMIQIIQKNGDNLEQTTDELIQKANDRGGDDNITVVLIQFHATDADEDEEDEIYDDDFYDQDTEILSVIELKNRMHQRRFPKDPP